MKLALLMTLTETHLICSDRHYPTLRLTIRHNKELIIEDESVLNSCHILID